MGENADNKGLDTESSDDEGETICFCFEVADTTIRKVIAENKVRDVDQVTELCDAGGGCGSCHPDIEELIEEFWQKEEQD